MRDWHWWVFVARVSDLSGNWSVFGRSLWRAAANEGKESEVVGRIEQRKL